MKNRFLKYSLILSFLILSFSNKLEANCPDLFSLDNIISFEALKDKSEIAWMLVKHANFDHPYFSTASQIEHRYLNWILDRILESNESILNHNQGSKSMYVGLIEISSMQTIEDLIQSAREQETGFSSLSNGLIQLVTNRKDFRYIPNGSDAIIAAILSHELSHILKRHHDAKKIYEQQLNEIEADNLGFEIYLNAGFPMELYKKLFLIYMELFFQEKYEFVSSTIGKNVELWRKWYSKFIEGLPSVMLYDSKTCISEGQKAIANGTLESFMESIKFANPQTDPHPSYCWRYWNIYQQEQQLLARRSSTTSKVRPPVYVALDLENSEGLDNIKSKLRNSRKEKVEESIYDSIVTELLRKNAKCKLSYSLKEVQLEGDQANEKILRSSETGIILIRANDFFSDLIFEGTRHVGSYQSVLNANDNFRTWLKNLLDGGGKTLDKYERTTIRKSPFAKKKQKTKKPKK